MSDRLDLALIDGFDASLLDVLPAKPFHRVFPPANLSLATISSTLLSCSNKTAAITVSETASGDSGRAARHTSAIRTTTNGTITSGRRRSEPDKFVV
jgi:hypothetical protein